MAGRRIGLLHPLLRRGRQARQPRHTDPERSLRIAAGRPRGSGSQRCRGLSGRDLPPGRATRRAVLVVRRVPGLCNEQRRRNAAPPRCRSVIGFTTPGRLRIELVRLRRDRRIAVARRRGAATTQPVRRHEGGRRAACCGVRGQLRARRHLPPSLQRVWAPAAARHGAAPDDRGGAREDVVPAVWRRVQRPRLHLRRRRRRGVPAHRVDRSRDRDRPQRGRRVDGLHRRPAGDRRLDPR